MRRLKIAFACAAMMLLAGLSWAEMPDFKKAVRIRDGANFLKVASDPTPTMVDWNNDGAKDLITGQFTQGHIWLFLNQGTDLNPVFSGGSYVESGGTPITTTYG
jgi:hypothetical protein